MQIRTYNFPFASVTSGFSWMSAAAHFIVLIFFKKYIADLRKGINVFRWYEYAFSSSLMIGLILMVRGRARMVHASCRSDSCAASARRAQRC